MRRPALQAPGCGPCSTARLLRLKRQAPPRLGSTPPTWPRACAGSHQPPCSLCLPWATAELLLLPYRPGRLQPTLALLAPATPWLLGPGLSCAPCHARPLSANLTNPTNPALPRRGPAGHEQPDRPQHPPLPQGHRPGQRVHRVPHRQGAARRARSPAAQRRLCQLLPAFMTRQAWRQTCACAQRHLACDGTVAAARSAHVAPGGTLSAPARLQATWWACCCRR